MDGGDVDDPAPPLRVHVRQRAPDQPERRFQHHGEHGVEDVRRELLDGPDQLQPGVVDQDVGAGGGRLGRVEVGEVQDAAVRRRPASPAACRGEGVEALGVPVDGPDLGPGGREPQRTGAADAAGRAGDECGTAAEVEVDRTGSGGGVRDLVWWARSCFAP